MFSRVSEYYLGCASLVAVVGCVLGFMEPDPPDYRDLVGNARWIVKYSNVSLVSTHSTVMPGFPFGQNKDVADGLYQETFGTGIPIIYNSPLATLTHDFKADPRVTFTYSAQFTHFCQKMEFDNDDPRCGKVMLTGDIVEVTDDNELAWAKKGMFSRHEATGYWPPSHNFSFYKLNIKNIFALDYFGGATKHMNITEYLNYQPTWGVHL